MFKYNIRCNLNASSTEWIGIICAPREFREPHMTPTLQLYWSKARVCEKPIVKRHRSVVQPIKNENQNP